MQRALVVVDDADTHRTLLREAGELAAGVGAGLLLLHFEASDQVDESQEQFAETEGVSVVEETLRSGQEFVSEFADDALADLDIEYETAAAIVEEGERADEILGAADRHDCDHVFLVGQKRSPTGKAIFGDVAQAVILNFEGPVTTLTA
jgi:nucleotide-binding universal stress UspA family protein